MKQILAAICITIFVFLASGCAESEETLASDKAEKAERLRNHTKEVLSNTHYIKDARTGLCFAYHWGGMVNGGPSLATVPCGAIPPHLFVVIQP